MRFWCKKLIIFILILSYTGSTWASGYWGLNYGMNYFSTDKLDELKTSGSGPGYGGVLGLREEFVGFEAFYQALISKTPIRHSGADYEINNSSRSFGGAIRLNFPIFFLRGGYAFHNINQEVLSGSTPVDNTAINRIYEIKEKRKDGGFMWGIGAHYRITRSTRIFVDYTNYQYNELKGRSHYVSVGFTYSFNSILNITTEKSGTGVD